MFILFELFQQNKEPVINEFMPDIAMGVSAMSLKERRVPEVSMEMESHEPHLSTAPPMSHSYSSRHTHSSRKRHAAEPKPEGPQPDYPDLYEFPGRHAPPYSGPDLYIHSRQAGSGPPPPAYSEPSDSLRLDVLEQPPQRLDLAIVSQGGGVAQGVHRSRPINETDLTCGLGPSSEQYEEWPTNRRSAPEGMGLVLGGNIGTGEEGALGARDRRSPNKPDYSYRKSAL